MVKLSGNKYDTPLGRLPRVTDILNQLDKPALRGWYSKMTSQDIAKNLCDLVDNDFEITKDIIKVICEEGKDAANKYRDKRATQGSGVHNLAERFYKGEKVDDDSKAWTNFLRFNLDHKVKPKQTEHGVYSIHGFAGTLDWLGDIDLIPSIMDIKTGYFQDYTHVMQIASYRQAEKEMSGTDIEQGVILYLGGESYKMKVVSGEELDEAFQKFLCLVHYWRLTKGEK